MIGPKSQIPPLLACATCCNTIEPCNAHVVLLNALPLFGSLWVFRLAGYRVMVGRARDAKAQENQNGSQQA
jgi:hypothetical protein